MSSENCYDNYHDYFQINHCTQCDWYCQPHDRDRDNGRQICPFCGAPAKIDVGRYTSKSYKSGFFGITMNYCDGVDWREPSDIEKRGTNLKRRGSLPIYKGALI